MINKIYLILLIVISNLCTITNNIINSNVNIDTIRNDIKQAILDKKNLPELSNNELNQMFNCGKLEMLFMGICCKSYNERSKYEKIINNYYFIENYEIPINKTFTEYSCGELLIGLKFIYQKKDDIYEKIKEQNLELTKCSFKKSIHDVSIDKDLLLTSAQLNNIKDFTFEFVKEDILNKEYAFFIIEMQRCILLYLDDKKEEEIIKLNIKKSKLDEHKNENSLYGLITEFKEYLKLKILENE